jgi:dihydroxyacetone kinase-like predicted kinase
VAVASGDGIAAMFGDLGVQQVVRGGQTLNPSTAELLAAVDAAPSEQVLVLPNNKNIVPVAGQLDALSRKRVVVVPTRSMPEGLASLVVYDPEAPAELNASVMTSAACAVATGEVTTAVRDAASSAGPVSAGEWIGLSTGEGIVSAGSSIVDIATSLLDRLLTPGRELLTVLVGEQAADADTDAIVAWVAAARSGVEVEVHRGDQPLYPYLFGAE